MIEPRLVLLGAGGHARVVLDIVVGQWGSEAIVLLDGDPERAGESLEGIPVLGGDDLLEGLRGRGAEEFLVTLGGPPNRRAALFRRALAHGLRPGRAIHRSAILSPSCDLGHGVTVMAGVVANARSTIGENVILNTGSVVEHDAAVAPSAHVAPGAVLCGGVWVGPEAHIGAGAVVLEGRSVGGGAIVGAGAVVAADVPEGARVTGVPARAT